MGKASGPNKKTGNPMVGFLVLVVIGVVMVLTVKDCSAPDKETQAALEIIREEFWDQENRRLNPYDLTAAQNPRGDGIFVYHEDENGICWFVIDGEGYPLNGRTKGFTPNLRWSNDNPNLDWSRTGLPLGGIGEEQLKEILAGGNAN